MNQITQGTTLCLPLLLLYLCFEVLAQNGAAGQGLHWPYFSSMQVCEMKTKSKIASYVSIFFFRKTNFLT